MAGSARRRAGSAPSLLNLCPAWRVHVRRSLPSRADGGLGHMHVHLASIVRTPARAGRTTIQQVLHPAGMSSRRATWSSSSSRSYSRTKWRRPLRRSSCRRRSARHIRLSVCSGLSAAERRDKFWGDSGWGRVREGNGRGEPVQEGSFSGANALAFYVRVALEGPTPWPRRPPLLRALIVVARARALIVLTVAASST